MPVYDYQALDTKGKTVTGIIDADGAQAARHKIRAMGSFPVKVKEVTGRRKQQGDPGRHLPGPVQPRHAGPCQPVDPPAGDP
jgi:general secretion pathway protein F